MAEGKRSKKLRNSIISAAGIGAVIATGIAVERAFVRKDRNREDPYRDEPYGALRGTPIGPVASFDGTLLHVEEAGSGPAIVLSHGFSLNLTLWHHQVKDLARDHRLVMYDHRGHGRSGRPPGDDWTLEALAHDLHAVLRDAAGDGPVTVVGHSMGGMSLLNYCHLYPDTIGSLVGGLVLVDTTAADVMGGIARIPRQLQAATQTIQEAIMRALVGRPDSFDRVRMNGSRIAYLGTRLMGFGPEPSPAQVDFVERVLAQCPSDVWANLIPTLFHFDMQEVLSVLKVPVLIVVGSHDRLTPPGASERMAAAIPGAELLVLEGAGHTSMLERHEEFNEALRNFVVRVNAADKARG